MKRPMKRLIALLLALALAAVFAQETGGIETGAAAGVGDSIADIVAQDPTFSTLAEALEVAGLTETLRSDGPFTVLAPTNDAFAALPAGELEALLADPEALSEVLLYHVLIGAGTSDDIILLTTAPTAQGSDVTVNASEMGVMVNDANVIETDILASNGVIHVIDAVLIPTAGAETGAAGAPGTETGGASD